MIKQNRGFASDPGMTRDARRRAKFFPCNHAAVGVFGAAILSSNGCVET
jgi:hypothetical protein